MDAGQRQRTQNASNLAADLVGQGSASSWRMEVSISVRRGIHTVREAGAIKLKQS
jgi:hypothetical protein